MHAVLIVAEGKYQGKVISVGRDKFIIGRHRECQLRVTSPKVSVHHCALFLREDGVWVKDLNSTNGTFVNDQAVSGERKLQHDDTLRIGPLVLRVQFNEKQPAEPPRPTRKKSARGLDESAIAQMLSAELEKGGLSGLLYVGEDSSYGSTIIKPVALSSKEDSDAKPKRKKP